MKYWRNAAALLTVYHPETTHCGNHCTPKDIKNEGRSGKVYENKGAMDKMSERMSAICAGLKPFLQKIGVSSSQNTSKVPRTYRTAGGAESLVLRLCGFSQVTPHVEGNSGTISNLHVQSNESHAWSELT